MTEAVKKEANAIYNIYFNMGCGFDKSPKLAIIHTEGLIKELEPYRNISGLKDVNKTSGTITYTIHPLVMRIKHLEQVKAYLEDKR